MEEMEMAWNPGRMVWDTDVLTVILTTGSNAHLHDVFKGSLFVHIETQEHKWIHGDQIMELNKDMSEFMERELKGKFILAQKIFEIQDYVSPES